MIKFLLAGFLSLSFFTPHPLYVSIIEIDHNAKTKELEVSVRIFTDDFENTLKKYSTAHIDLTHPSNKALMDKLVSDYLQKHLQIKADNKPAAMHYLGFEVQQESVWAFFEVPNIPSVKKMDITANVLYDYQDKQMNIIHAKVNGVERSYKLDNPATQAGFSW
jgi:hypothetical protein